MLRNIAEDFIQKKGLRKNRAFRPFFVTELYKTRFFCCRSRKIGPQPIAGCKVRLLRSGCGKLLQNCGEPVESLGKYIQMLWKGCGICGENPIYC